ncbi:hypothetical protein VS883_28505, partial [Escherichia coli]
MVDGSLYRRIFLLRLYPGERFRGRNLGTQAVSVTLDYMQDLDGGWQPVPKDIFTQVIPRRTIPGT